MSGATQPQVAITLGNSLTPHPKSSVTISCPADSSDGETNVPVSIAGGAEQLSGLSNPARFNAAISHQRTFPDHFLDNSEQFYDDPPYVPPRISQAELTYPAHNPRGISVYDPTVQQPYPFESGTSPSDSVESSWSTSSSASSQQILHGYDLEPTSQFSQTHRTSSNPQHYPAYHGKQRIGLEHVHYGEHPASTADSYYRTPQSYPLLVPGTYSNTNVQASMPTPMGYPSASSQSHIPSTNHPQNASASSAPADDNNSSIFSDTAGYLRVQLGLSPHQSVSLHSLPDPPPGEKPSTPLPMLIKLAIYGSPKKQLTLQEIYNELENRFQWFRDHKHERAWKNSIRHNLSLNKVFKHVPRPITEPGKGSYWRLDVSGGEGYKRTRKRRPKNRVTVSEEEVSEMEDDRQSPMSSSQAAGPSRSPASPVEDATIDPELRAEGHVVGEGRARSATRRVGGGSPYPQQSPRYQQGPLPAVVGSEIGQPSIRFGQPSFGFPTYSQTRPMPLADVPSTSPFASSSMEMAVNAQPRPQLQSVASYDQLPPSPPRAGVEYASDTRSLLATQHAATFTGEPAQGNTPHSSPSSSSGSSRTWRDPRSGS